jgi:hypothetical protein
VNESSLTLMQLPEQLAALDSPIAPEALELVRAEHQRWRELHDRLIALIAAFLDEAVEQGRALPDVLDAVVARTTVDVSDLVGMAVQAPAIAALLRAHGSTGSVQPGPSGRTEFRHQCGTGLALWRRSPDQPVIADGEVPGVPGGVPRYCARCMHSIGAFGDAWRVTPPVSPSGHCTWTVTEEPPADGHAGTD